MLSSLPLSLSLSLSRARAPSLSPSRAPSLRVLVRHTLDTDAKKESFGERNGSGEKNREIEAERKKEENENEICHPLFFLLPLPLPFTFFPFFSLDDLFLSLGNARRLPSHPPLPRIPSALQFRFSLRS